MRPMESDWCECPQLAPRKCALCGWSAGEKSIKMLQTFQLQTTRMRRAGIATAGAQNAFTCLIKFSLNLYLITIVAHMNIVHSIATRRRRCNARGSCACDTRTPHVTIYHKWSSILNVGCWCTCYRKLSIKIFRQIHPSIPLFASHRCQWCSR